MIKDISDQETYSCYQNFGENIRAVICGELHRIRLLSTLLHSDYELIVTRSFLVRLNLNKLTVWPLKDAKEPTA